jgi:hypothetical protein
MEKERPSHYAASLNPCRVIARIGMIESGQAMAITYFMALPFDVIDGSVIVGKTIECSSPAAAIEIAQGLWKVLGHTGAVAFSRTGDPATGNFPDATVLRKFGDVPDDLKWVELTVTK